MQKVQIKKYPNLNVLKDRYAACVVIFLRTKPISPTG
jgi:hypothetical protein